MTASGRHGHAALGLPVPITSIASPMSTSLRIAFIASSGGGTVRALANAAAAHHWPLHPVGILTDRSCGAETVAADLKIPAAQIPFDDSVDDWSLRAARTLRLWSPDLVVLFFLRRVGPAVWRDLGCPVWNLHPSLLPAYPGLNALRSSYVDSRDPLCPSRPHHLGVTLHRAVDRADTGPIIAQARFNPPATLDQADHLAFLAKLSLLAEASWRVAEGRLHSPDASRRSLPLPPESAWIMDHRPWPPRPEVADAVSSFAQPWVLPAHARSA
jgi:phosphoribosylglycinamide formyltransferase 1